MPSQLLKFLSFLFMWQSVFNVTERALTALLRFLKYVILALGLAFQNHQLTAMSDRIPVTIMKAEKLLGIDDKGIINYVVCSKCHSVYEYKDCVKEKHNGLVEAKLCSFVKYPNHCHQSKRKPCQSPLFKETTAVNKHLQAIKVYPYFPLKLSIQRLVLRPGFLRECEEWRERERTIPENILGDISDGLVWKSFKEHFLSSPFSYLLTINVDWFQPFKRTEYSVGGIYATIQNLPREKRYKEENAILIGIIPGPKEPSLSIDTYLKPLINELKSMYVNGISVSTPQGTQITVRVAVSCISCDIPATRKVCGFLSHNANLGCNKCYKNFNDCTSSKFDRGSWIERTSDKHLSDCAEILKETTKTGIQVAESQRGVRNCALLDLPYYDPIRFVAIDIMHNLYLGTGKHMFVTWIELGLLSNEDLTTADVMIKNFVVPNNIGRLPIGLKSNYAAFKASQWSSWITIYSPIILKHLLPDEHYRYWLLFVRACNILSQRIIKLSDVRTADALLELFCKHVERLCGHEYCTPNMHMHLHLQQTILDFGPAHATWCFSFERYNGKLGSISTNKQSVENQFMQRFLRTQMANSLFHRIDDPELLQLLPPDTSNVKSSSLEVNNDSDLFNLLELSHGNLDCNNFKYNDSIFTQLQEPQLESVFNSHDCEQLHSLYQQLNPHCSIEYISPFYIRSGRASIGGDILGSTMNNRSARSLSTIAAYWPTEGNSISCINYSHKSIGKVSYYFTQSITVRKAGALMSQKMQYTMAFVQWMETHPQHSLYGISATLCYNTYMSPSLCSFIPVLRIIAKCASCNIVLDDEEIFVACPIPIKLCI